MSDGLSPRSGRHHFFDAMSLSMALSSTASASNFLSLAFSSSSAFSRLASETSRPPYLARTIRTLLDHFIPMIPGLLDSKEPGHLVRHLTSIR